VAINSELPFRPPMTTSARGHLVSADISYLLENIAYQQNIAVFIWAD